MRTIFFVALAIVAVCSAQTLQQQFEEFQAKYGKVYASDAETAQRFQYFSLNMRQLATQQLRMARNQQKWNAGITFLFDRSPEELMLWKGGRSYSADALATSCLAHGVTSPSPALINLPADFDWRNKSVVNPIKNQGQCGSCWAFSTIGVIESAWAIKGHALTSFSEQEIVDCSHGCSNEPPYGAVCNQGCNGGWQWNAFSDVVTWKGVNLESKYPYTAETGVCKGVNNTGLAPLKNYTCLSSPQGKIASEADMAAYLVANGPIAIAMDAGILETYTSGIITPATGDCSQVQLDHALVIVGYGSAAGTDFWIVRNSWGTSWGEEGYFRIQRGTNACGLAAAVSSPQLA